ncbi:DUF4010 domain-containing protein [Candidatus Dojkabacteria bacterium]|nr:DUF4010 domain-containing protein [Candidatus Dojkabacteria bacterium]
MEPILLEKFLIAIGIGALIGVEREREKQKHTNLGSGFRTFILISLLGAVCAFLLEKLNSNLIFIVMFGAFAALVIATYWAFAKQGLYGIITEVSSLLTFTFGFLALTEYTIVAIVLVVVVVILIESERVVHSFIRNTSADEWADTLKFATIALIIYPILPKTPIDPWGLVNPSSIWLLVVLISGLEFVGYFLIKTIGSNIGVVLNGFLGGLVSSTAVAFSMTNQSKKYKSLTSSLVAATTIASLTMFLRVIIVISFLAPKLLGDIFLFMLPIFITMVVLGVLFSKSGFVMKEENKKDFEINLGSPFHFKPALKMAAMFALVKIAIQIAEMYLGNSGVYLTSALSGLVDVDAITLSISSMFNDSTIFRNVAVQGIILAVTMNTALKGTLAKINGEKKFGNKILVIFGGTALVGVATIIFLVSSNGLL